MTSCHNIRPLLPAQAEELTLFELRTRAEHVAECARCATEAAAYSRLGQALAVMANLEVDPADGTLERRPRRHRPPPYRRHRPSRPRRRRRLRRPRSPPSSSPAPCAPAAVPAAAPPPGADLRLPNLPVPAQRWPAPSRPGPGPRPVRDTGTYPWCRAVRNPARGRCRRRGGGWGCRVVFLQGVGDPAGGAGDGEDRLGGAAGHGGDVGEGGQGEVDVRLGQAPAGGGLEEGVDHRHAGRPGGRGAEPGQEEPGARRRRPGRGGGRSPGGARHDGAGRRPRWPPARAGRPRPAGPRSPATPRRAGCR